MLLPLLLLLVGIVSLCQRQRQPGWWGRIGGIVTTTGLGLTIIGTAVEFWSFPWGSYSVDFAAPLPPIGGVLQAVASLVFTVGLIMLTSALVHAKIVPLWTAPVLIVGGLTTFFLTPVSWLCLTSLGCCSVGSCGGRTRYPETHTANRVWSSTPQACAERRTGRPYPPVQPRPLCVDTIAPLLRLGSSKMPSRSIGAAQLSGKALGRT
jgi:hypothetical protein